MDDAEWTLRAGPWSAVVSPFGASLRRLQVEQEGRVRDVLWGYSGAAGKRGGQGDVLFPFPGRVRDGAYTFAGERHQLERNDKEGPNAIHGFVRGLPWQGRQDGRTAEFHVRLRPGEHPGYPFDVELGVAYEVTPKGLVCAFVARNPGDSAVPVGVGFHPYIQAAGGVDAARLSCPAGQVIEFEGLLPTGRVEEVPAALDFRASRVVGPARLNHCFTGLVADGDGFTRLVVDDVEVWMGPAFPYVVLYTGDALGADARKALAVEPMTCATDALNHPEWGLTVLGPGEAWTGSWGVALKA